MATLATANQHTAARIDGDVRADRQPNRSVILAIPSALVVGSILAAGASLGIAYRRLRNRRRRAA